MGWSAAKYIDREHDHYIQSNYLDAKASWFQKNWWSVYDWGWIYTNDTQMPLRLKKAVFSACAGHSNGKNYRGSYTESSVPGSLITWGRGCTFTSDVYVVDKNGNKVGSPKKNVGKCDIPSIADFNCYYEGYGNTCLYYNPWTNFGDPELFGPGTAYHKDRNDVPRCRQPITIQYSDAPMIPVGGKMFVVIRPTAWKTSDDNALLVMKGDSSNFDYEFEPEDQDYIWVCKQKLGDSAPKWYKEKKAFMRTSTGWEEMKGV